MARTRSLPKPQLVPPPEVPGKGRPVHPFDGKHGTDTGGLIPGSQLVTGHPSDKHVTAYYAVAPSILRGLLDLWIDRTAPPFAVDHYTLVDLGAGKGRAMLVGAEYPFREVVGVELNPELAAIARRNIEVVEAEDEVAGGLLSSPRLVEGDVLALKFPETPTVVFLFNPFEAPLLRKLLRVIEAQFRDRPGQMDVLYVNAEHAVVLDRHPAFRKLWQGAVAMSTEDHIADLREIAEQLEYGSTGDEQCAIYRYVGRAPKPE